MHTSTLLAFSTLAITSLATAHQPAARTPTITTPLTIESASTSNLRSLFSSELSSVSAKLYSLASIESTATGPSASSLRAEYSSLEKTLPAVKSRLSSEIFDHTTLTGMNSISASASSSSAAAAAGGSGTTGSGLTMKTSSGWAPVVTAAPVAVGAVGMAVLAAL